ncbi:MAG: ABC transporter substrate-binding protein, partial [Clostridia bacterium]|nr:ABC transporter substrate-binding protein [Clostridia bacterium]
MKKTVKKLTAVGLTLTSVMGLVACGGSNAGTGTEGGATTAAEKKEVTKPTSFSVMVDNTVLSEENGGKAFYEYLEQVTGLAKGTITWVRPPHSSYYDSVKSAFTSGTEADVVLLSSDYYALYAANGMLWNMTDAWANSETKNSGRLISTADNVLSSLLVAGEDGKKGMYGFSPYRGNGCCTYIKKAWLEKAGIDVAKVENVTMDFNTYYGYLKEMAKAAGHFVISAPGFVSNEAPYTNYLPEFFQKAQYSFYKNTSGKYVDGFSEQIMKDALQRIQTGVADGVIDKASNGQTTADARNKFYSTDPTTESGVFTYWAGTWAETLRKNLAGKGLDETLIAINPIKELGKYTERLAPAWCITTKAQNPEGIFKYFIDTMLDGGDAQLAWEAGAKGTHWDTKAESVTLKGKEDKPTTYEEGKFHFLPAPEDPTKLISKNHIDPILALAKYKDGTMGPVTIVDTAKKNGEWFAQNCESAVALPMTDALSDNLNDV